MISKMSQEELKNLPLSDLKSALNSKKQVLKATLENPKNAHLLGKMPPERLAEIRALVGLKDTQLKEKLMDQMKHLPKESQLKIMDAIIMKLEKAQKLLQK